jgi:hypothetical protein
LAYGEADNPPGVFGNQDESEDKMNDLYKQLLENYKREFSARIVRRGRPPQTERRTEILAELQLLRENADLRTPGEYLEEINHRVEPQLSLSSLRRYLREAGIRFRGPKKTKPPQ